MARVTFKDPKATLRGTFCGMEYRVRNGQTFVYAQRQPYLPKKPTAVQRARYRRKCVLQRAVCEIQERIYRQVSPSMARMQAIADMYHAIYQHCDERYEAWRYRFESDSKLTEAIAYWYITERYSPELFETSRLCATQSTKRDTTRR